jgi:alpha-tubulin suppressor-like RCC1 family protein
MSDSTTTYQWWTWGNNHTGMLGNNSTASRSSPIQIPGSWTGFNKEMGNNATYGDVNLGAKADGTLWAWGDNEYGALGQNNLVQYSSPVQIPGTDWSESFINASQNSFVIKSNGEMYGMGINYQGSLGINASGTNPNNNARSSPVQIPGTTWKSVTVANWATVATKTDGTMWSWGYNHIGQLGVNDKTHRSSPTQIPGTTWDTVYSGNYVMFGTKTDGTLWAWGNNASGTLGQNNKTRYSSPTQIPGTTWKKATGSEKSAGAVKTDGTLWVWGLNQSGVFGTNDATDASSPRQVPGTTWNDIASNSYIMYASKTDGTLWAWGFNGNGELGQNDLTTRSSPIQIPGKTVNFVSSGALYGKAFIEE